jgi:hypothetical protein
MVNANPKLSLLNQFLIIFEKGFDFNKKNQTYILNFQTLQDSVALKTGPTSAEKSLVAFLVIIIKSLYCFYDSISIL